MKKKILVVDDQAVLREGLRRLLENEGFEVETFSDGRRAVGRAQESPVDLVITDLKMPGMSGIEVVRTIKLFQPQVPIIIITGFSFGDFAMEAIRSGAAAYIAKPFTTGEILQKIQEVLSSAALMQPEEEYPGEWIRSAGC